MEKPSDIQQGRLGLEAVRGGQEGILILETDPKGQLIVQFDFEARAEETFVQAQARAEERAREILLLASNVDFDWSASDSV